jgi:DNA modification methylase
MTEFINEIITGDNVEILRNMPDNFVDLTVTSPPYDNLRTYNGCAWDFESLANELYRVTKFGGVVVWIVNDATIDGSESGTSFRQALYFKDIGFNLHDTMIWNKGTSPFQHKNRYINCFEYMFVFSKGKPKTYNIIKDRKNKWAGTQIHGTERQKTGYTKPLSETQKSKKVKDFGSRLNIWDIAPEKNNRTGHPAVFPEKIANDHIITWSNPNDIVLDPFGGSGTTAKMALKNGRKFIHIDISEEYNHVARKRIF